MISSKIKYILKKYHAAMQQDYELFYYLIERYEPAYFNFDDGIEWNSEEYQARIAATLTINMEFI